MGGGRNPALKPKEGKTRGINYKALDKEKILNKVVKSNPNMSSIKTNICRL